MPDDNQPTTEIAPGVPTPQIVSNPDPLTAQLGTIMALLGFAITFTTTIVGLIGQHETAALVVYITSMPVITGLAGIGTLAIGYWRWHKRSVEKARETKLVAAAPASMAMTKQEVAAIQSAPTIAHAQRIAQEIDAVAAATRDAADAGIAVDPAPRT